MLKRAHTEMKMELKTSATQLENSRESLKRRMIKYMMECQEFDYTNKEYENI